MDKPTNVVCINITGGVRITWDEGTNVGTMYQIWVSVSGGAYSLVTTLRSGVKTYDDTQAPGQNLSYKVVAVSADQKSLQVRSKFDYTNYTIEPLVHSDGTIMHVEFQRDNMVFASKTGYLMWSTDKGYTFNNYSFTDSNIIVASHIFSNGNVLFFTNKNELWLGKNGLNTITQKYLKDTDGSTYVYHTPQNASYPGMYFCPLNFTQPTVQDGVEMLVIGNYAMYTSAQMRGAIRNLVYYSADLGETTKIAYKWGLDPDGYAGTLDNGTAAGGAGGVQLGDSGNALGCAHNHYIAYDAYTKEWFVSTGERGTLIKGTYNTGTDAWTWTTVLDSPNKFYRSCGMIITSTHYIFISDSGTAAYDGAWSCLKADIADYTKFTQIYDIEIPVAPGINYGNIFIGGHYNNGMGITVSVDNGDTWNDYLSFPIAGTGGAILRIIGYPNTDGDFTTICYNWSNEIPYGRQSYLIHFK